MAKRARRIVKSFLIAYVAYAFVTGVLAFAVHPDATEYLETTCSQRFYGTQAGADRVALVEDRMDSLLSRIDLIDRATGTLDIAYYSVDSGLSTDLFFAAILEAADRGVQVRILLDGIFHHLRGDLKLMAPLLALHPNIELSYYEPFSLIRPWTWQNRLHDKIILVDSTYFLTGGRNIGDRYFLEPYEGAPVYDRDILVIRTDPEASSALDQAADYFASLWESPYSVKCEAPGSLHTQQKALAYGEELKKWNTGTRAQHADAFGPMIDWNARSVPTNRVTLVHNPLERMNKKPYIWAEIVRLIESAEDTVWLQSPYIVPIRSMRRFFSAPVEAELEVLTNSIPNSPNYPAIAGYLNKRERLLDCTPIYEYHGDGSIHAKSLIINDRLSLIGTFNIDPRSVYLSTETMVVVDSEPFAGILTSSFRDLKAKSIPAGEGPSASPAKRIALAVTQLAVWPFPYLL